MRRKIGGTKDGADSVGIGAVVVINALAALDPSTPRQVVVDAGAAVDAGRVER